MKTWKNIGLSLATLVTAAIPLAPAVAADHAAPQGGLHRVKGTVMSHFAAAYAASGTRWTELYNMLCPRLQNASAGKIAEPPNVREDSINQARGSRAFDNLYYVGEKDVWESSPSSWAINTSDGIILLDTLNPDSGPIVIERSLREVGLDPHNIKYIVVTHAHKDHFGGARYLQQKYGAHVLMSTEDWAFMASTTPADQRPVHDMDIKDGDTLTLGGETLHLYVTPGHTPGTVSTILPVTDNGVKHVVAQWGGTGFGFGGAKGRDEARWFETYYASAERFRSLVANAHADVLIANHSILDNTDANTKALDERKPGDSNPWVVGERAVQGYVTTAAECAAAGDVAMGPSLDSGS